VYRFAHALAATWLHRPAFKAIGIHRIGELRGDILPE